MFIMLFDEQTGRLRLDPSIVSASGKLGYVDLENQQWQHGPTGPAWAHAGLFINSAN
jgi:hypothetical protein